MCSNTNTMNHFHIICFQTKLIISPKKEFFLFWCKSKGLDGRVGIGQAAGEKQKVSPCNDSFEDTAFPPLFANILWTSDLTIYFPQNKSVPQTQSMWKHPQILFCKQYSFYLNPMYSSTWERWISFVS